MINAIVGKRNYRVHSLVNRGRWFGKTWLLSIAVGFDSINFVIEADNESAAIDEFTDSKYGRMIKTDDLCNACESENYNNCQCSFAGNYGDRVDLNYVSIQKCKVDYFAKKEL